MCLNKRLVRISTGRTFYVNCGHCPACLQEKAYRRTSRINYNAKDGYISLFVTLTYENKFCPYFDIREFRQGDIYESSNIKGFDDGDLVRDVVIYRDAKVRKVRVGSDYDISYKVNEGTHELTTVVVPFFHESEFKPLQNYSPYKIGVIYYKDVQNFGKRLRINLKRDNYVFDLKIFNCSEYGSNTLRPHFHLLVSFPSRYIDIVKSSIVASWPFSNLDAFPESIQIARNAASYVSSYVNCASSVPETLKSTVLRPKHSYSKGYGMGLRAFSFNEVCKSFYRRDLRFDYAHFRKGAFVVDNMLLPKYIIGRYFPKIKGLMHLSSDEIIFICERPERLGLFARRLNYEKDDFHRNYIKLKNKLKYAFEHGISNFEYAFIYSRIWPLYSTKILESFYISQDTPANIYYAYDNIKDFLESNLDSPSLSVLLDDNIPSTITDPNYFPANVARDSKYRKLYHEYQKEKDVRNYVYSKRCYLL